MNEPQTPQNQVPQISKAELLGCKVGCIGIITFLGFLWIMWSSSCILKTTNDLRREVERAQR